MKIRLKEVLYFCSQTRYKRYVNGLLRANIKLLLTSKANYVARGKNSTFHTLTEHYQYYHEFAI